MHKIAQKRWSEKIFRAYDIRGIYPDEINEEAVYRIARAFADYLRIESRSRANLKIIVSSDARTSSPALKEALLDGLMEEGVEVIDAGLTTAPMHYFIVNKTKADGGAMITASHLSTPFNGIKLVKSEAMPIAEGFGMAEIKNVALRGIFEMKGEKGNITKKDFINDYIAFFENKFSSLKSFQLKLAACAGNGMASILLRKLFAKFPKLKIEFLHDDLDMTFPNHEADPLKEENLKDVQDAVLKRKAALGISFDGDGDRIGFVDDAGNIVRGDIITALLASYFVTNGDRVIYDLRASRVVREEIEKKGGKALESRVGHSFIKALMREEGAVFGGEFSGHYYFKDFFFAESAIFALFTIMSIIQNSSKKLSELARPLLRYSKSHEINFTVKNKEKTMDKMAAQFPDSHISYLDGIKVEYDDWWFNLRPSANEDLLRLNIEAATPELLSKKKKLLAELLAQ